SGAQGVLKEFARTYKMNSNCRKGTTTSPIPPQPGVPAANVKNIFANLSDIKHPANFVLYGDGVSLDETGPVASQSDSGEFSMQNNGTTNGSTFTWNGSDSFPALRHNGGANIVFVDGHAANMQLATTTYKITTPAVTVKVYQSEFLQG